MASFLEIGCGTGFVLSGVAQRFPQAKIVGSEIFVSGLAYAAQRLRSVELVQMDARRVPYRENFDVVAALDVIEHIEEDELVLEQLFSVLRPGGYRPNIRTSASVAMECGGRLCLPRPQIQRWRASPQAVLSRTRNCPQYIACFPTPACHDGVAIIQS